MSRPQGYICTNNDAMTGSKEERNFMLIKGCLRLFKTVGRCEGVCVLNFSALICGSLVIKPFLTCLIARLGFVEGRRTQLRWKSCQKMKN